MSVAGRLAVTPVGCIAVSSQNGSANRLRGGRPHGQCHPGDAEPLDEGVADSLEPAPFGMQFVRVPFDTEAEIAAAEAAGMPETREYAIELRTGLYRGYQEA